MKAQFDYKPMLIANTIWMMLSHLLSRGTIVLCGVLVAKFFNAESFTSYSFFILTITTIAIYSAMGLGVTATKFYAQLDIKKNTPIISLWLLNLVLALFGSLVFFIFFAYIVPVELNINKFLMVLIIFFTSMDIYNLNALIGLEKYKSLAKIAISSSVINLLFLFLAIYENNIIFSMYGLLIATFLQFFFGFFTLLKYLDNNNLYNKIKIQILDFNIILKSMGPLIFVSIISASGTWVIGRLILSDSNKNFANFSIGMQWYSLALFIPTMVSRVLLPFLIKNKNDHTKLIFNNCYLVVFFCLFFSLMSYIMHPFINSFYGDQYGLHPFLIPSYLLAAAIGASSNILGNFIISKNKEIQWLYLVCVTFLTVLISCFLFKDYGEWVGSISLGVGSLVLVLCSIFIIKKING